MIWQRMILSVALTLAAATTTMACGSDEAAGPAPERNSKESANVEAGSQAVVKRRCVDCHSSSAGTMAGAATALGGQKPGIELYAPNLTPDIETGLGDPNAEDPGKRGYTDNQLAAAIRTGYDKDGLELCPQMKHFADMTDFEVYSIIKYLRSLPPVKNKVLRSVCPPLKTKAEQTAAGG